jgi:hypothetical protein
MCRLKSWVLFSLLRGHNTSSERNMNTNTPTKWEQSTKRANTDRSVAAQALSSVVEVFTVQAEKDKEILNTTTKALTEIGSSLAKCLYKTPSYFLFSVKKYSNNNYNTSFWIPNLSLLPAFRFIEQLFYDVWVLPPQKSTTPNNFTTETQNKMV